MRCWFFCAYLFRMDAQAFRAACDGGAFGCLGSSMAKLPHVLYQEEEVVALQWMGERRVCGLRT